MDIENDQKERIFQAAVEINCSDRRAAYIESACRDDPQLRQEIEDLLRHDNEAQSFLDGPVFSSTRGNRPGNSIIFEAPGAVIGPYKLLEQIGEGAFGLVFVAEQKRPVRRKVAVKIIKPGMDTKEVLARFEAERQVLALMNHPNITQVFDAGATESGRPYFVMELVKGLPITEYCDLQARSPYERLDLFISVCRAVQHAHTNGIIHRDLKPSNILVAPRDGVPVVKVIDFGIAKSIGQKLTENTVYTGFMQMVGTPIYMSPEQAEINTLGVDTRSDIYSLGVLLYELLTGTTPLPRERLSTASFDEIRRLIREEEPPKPSTMLSTLGAQLATVSTQRNSDPSKLSALIKGDLDWIVMKTLEKDRSRRYETVDGLLQDLKRHLNDEPVAARPPSAAYRLQKMWRRNRLEWTAMALVLVSLVLGTVVSFMQATRADQERMIAQRNLYAANLNLIQQAWQQNNVMHVDKLLAETADFDERGFEWYYWQRQMNRQDRTLLGHTDLARAVAYSPNGRRLVTGSEDRTAIVWDLETGEEIHTLSGHRSAISSVAFTPDGSRIVTASFDQTARVWNATNYQELVLLKGHGGAIVSIAIAPDSDRILTASDDHTAIVWDAHTGDILHQLAEHTDRVRSAVFSPDGRRAVTSSWDQTTVVWDLENGTVLSKLTGHTVQALAWSADGRWIAGGCKNGTVVLWDAAGDIQETSPRILSGRHTSYIETIAISPDSLLVASGSSDNTANLWSIETGERLWTIKGHSRTIRSVAFSPDSKQIATASDDETVRLWPAAMPDDPLALDVHQAAAESVAFFPNRPWIVSGSRDGTVRVSDAASGLPVYEPTHHLDRVSAVAVSPDGSRIATGSWDHTTILWNASNGSRLTTLKGHTDRIWATEFSSDGERVATGSEDGTLKIWDVNNGKQLHSIKTGSGRVLAVAFSPDGNRVVAGLGDASAKSWDVDSGSLLQRYSGHSDDILCVTFTPDGDHIVTGSADGTTTLWDATTGERVQLSRGHVGRVTSASVSFDGLRIITSGGDGTVKLWDCVTGKQLLTLEGNRGPIRSAAISADGRRIAAACDDGEILVWQCAGSQQVRQWLNDEQLGRSVVSTRRRERKDEADHLRLTRLQDPGAIRNWLIAAPIPTKTRDGAASLNDDRFAVEFEMLPRAGDSVHLGDERRIWRPVRLDDYKIDFHEFVGERIDWNAAYAVCYVWSDRDQANLLVKVGSDDQAVVLLNGSEIYRRTTPRPYIADIDDIKGVSLKAGRNVVFFYVSNETNDWCGSLRFTDANDRPIQGIEVTLDPDGAGL